MKLLLLMLFLLIEMMDETCHSLHINYKSYNKTDSSVELNSPHLSESADLLNTFLCSVVHLVFCGEPANTKPNTHKQVYIDLHVIQLKSNQRTERLQRTADL